MTRTLASSVTKRRYGRWWLDLEAVSSAGLIPVLVAMLVSVWPSAAIAETTGASESAALKEKSFIQVNDSVPAGFDNFVEKQTTEADVYYGGLYLTSAFVEFDPLEVEILDPTAVIAAIPNVRDPRLLTEMLTGVRPTNAHLRCNSRVREACGKVSTTSVDVLFDESRFRLDIFVGSDELLQHSVEHDKYLPDATVDRSALHNIRMSIAGVGSDRRYNIGSESFLSVGDSRVRARYSLADEGFSLYEMSWQQDQPDVEYEIGSFRTLGRNIAFANDLDVIGARIASSTKRRVDLDQALGTPVFLFLTERSRVDVYRGSELIHSRYYEAGNQQIDASGFPDGAYDVAMRITSHSGERSEQTQFYVKSGMMPPKGEPQYYVESGMIVDTSDTGLPEVTNDVWLRAGASHRIRDDLSLDNEMAYAGRKAIAQSGIFFLQEGWHLYTGAMLSNKGDMGFSLRGGFHIGSVSANFDYRQVDVDESLIAVVDTELTDQQFDLFPSSYRQGVASLAFPVWKGRFFLRGRLNQRAQYTEKSVGFSYWTPLFEIGRLSANFNLDGNYSRDRSWIQAGVQIRWQRQQESVVLNPGVRYRDEQDSGQAVNMLANGRWNGSHELPYVGATNRSVSLDHGTERSHLSARFVPKENPNSDLEFGMQRSATDSRFFYAMNNRFSVASSGGKTQWGDGGRSAGAVLISVSGEISAKFEVLVNDRVAGYVWAGKPNAISLRPYETYNVRIQPVGAKFVGFDDRVQTITIYPGNVEALDFVVRELTVLVGQAVYPDGSAVVNRRFQNVEGFGSTDAEGWFQVELSHREPLIIEGRGTADGTVLPRCKITLPHLKVEQGLAVTDTLICQPILAQR